MSKAKTKKEIAPQAEHAGALTEFEGQTWGAEEISNEDIIIPKIMLMQPMSELVTDGIASIGEFRDSLNKDKKIGDSKTPVSIIVFGSFKTWVEFKDGEYLTTKPMTPENSGLPQEEIVEEGAVITRDRVMNFYCLRPEDIEAGEAFPYVLACRRTSYGAGKKIATHLKKLQMFRKPAAAKVFSLSSRKETNDKGTFFVMDIDVKGDSTNEQVKAAYIWHQALNSQRDGVKIDDGDLSPAGVAKDVGQTGHAPEATV